MKNILITGLNNLASEGILRTLHSESDFHIHILSNKVNSTIKNSRITVHPINLLNFNALKKIIYSIKPDCIIFSHNYGNLNSNDKSKIQLENYQTLDYIVRITRILDNHLIYISNEFVFSGEKGPYSEEDKPGTNNYYGSTIHSAENLALTSVNKCTVVRHSLIYGHSLYGFNNFTEDFITKLKNNETYQIPYNYYTNPVLLEEFSYAVLKILENNLLGIYHISGSEYTSLDNFLLLVADLFNFDTDKINIHHTTKLKKFGLINLKAQTNLGINFSNLQNGLTSMIHYSYGNKLVDL